jgi:hypothetical protein
MFRFCLSLSLSTAQVNAIGVVLATLLSWLFRRRIIPRARGLRVDRVPGRRDDPGQLPGADPLRGPRRRGGAAPRGLPRPGQTAGGDFVSGAGLDQLNPSGLVEDRGADPGLHPSRGPLKPMVEGRAVDALLRFAGGASRIDRPR